MDEYTKNIKDRLDRVSEELERMVKDMAEVRAFLRLLNSSEESIPDAALDMFDELCDKHIPNG